MIFKCGCKSIVGHDSEGDTTLTLEHSSNCKHASAKWVEAVEKVLAIARDADNDAHTWFDLQQAIDYVDLIEKESS